MQKKLVGRFFNIIPTEVPRLDFKTYTHILEHLFNDAKDYVTLKLALTTYPKYIINHEHILQVINDAIKKDE